MSDKTKVELALENISNFTRRFSPSEMQEIYEAMQVYTDQEKRKEAIAFYLWMRKCQWSPHVRVDAQLIFSDFDSDKKYSLEELYGDYLQSLPKTV